MKITIGNRELTHISASITLTMDTGSDGFECTIPWLPGEDPELDELIKPRSFTKAEASIDGKVLVRGLLFIRTPNLSNDGSTLDLQFFSPTKHIIDSQAKPPYEFKKKSLLSIATELGRPYGIRAIGQDDGESTEQFDREVINPTESIFEFLQNRARQRGVLMSNTKDGDMLFLKATRITKPLASITEGDLQFGSVETGQTFSAVFDDTMVYQIYRVLGDSPRSNTEPSFATAIDKNIPVPRRKTLTALNETKGGIQKTADWTKNKSLAESLGIPFPVTNWRTPAGDLWEPNRLVTVTSPTIFVPDGFDFLIRQVEFIDEAGGETAVLDIVPPQLYTQENIPEPWAST